jgi:hypothetical protein
MSCGQRGGTPRAVNLSFLDRSRYFSFQGALHLSSRGWVDPVPDSLLLRKSGSPGNRTQGLWVCSQEIWSLDQRGSHFREISVHFHGSHFQISCETLINCRKNRSVLFVLESVSKIISSGETNQQLSLDTAGIAQETSCQNFFYCCPCIFCRDVFIEPIPSKSKGIITRKTRTDENNLWIRAAGMDLTGYKIHKERWGIM